MWCEINLCFQIYIVDTACPAKHKRINTGIDVTNHTLMGNSLLTKVLLARLCPDNNPTAPARSRRKIFNDLFCGKYSASL